MANWIDDLKQLHEAATELSPCPFCGCLAWMVIGHFDNGELAYRAECQGKCKSASTNWHKREQAVAAWNQRAADLPRILRVLEAAEEVAPSIPCTCDPRTEAQCSGCKLRAALADQNRGNR